MNTLSRIPIIALLAAVPAYLFLSNEMPHINPEYLYSISAFLGLLLAVVVNFIWIKLPKKREKK